MLYKIKNGRNTLLQWNEMGSWYGMNGRDYVCLQNCIRDICRQETVRDSLAEMGIWVNLKKTKLKITMCLITHHTLKMCV